MRRFSPRGFVYAIAKPLLFWTALATALATTAGVAYAQAASGRASATGADSLSVNGQNFRLFGIDGLAFNQSCFVDGQPFACGVSATRALQTLLEPAAVSCEPKGTSASGVMLASCEGHDGDVALRMVEQGWALADREVSDTYAAAEDAARANKAGAWRGTFLRPKDYREEMGAIEARFAQRAGEAARAEVEAAIIGGALDLRGLKRVSIESVDAPPAGTQIAAREIRFGAFQPGFIDGAIEPPAVFNWGTVAGVLDATRREGVDTIEGSVAAAIREELATRPSQTVETRNADDFYAALKSGSATWLAEGRQPILFVMAPDLPNWVRGWFAGQPPTGAEISRRAEVADPAYLGTIDGVDVYIGPGQKRAAILVPSDLLLAVIYQKDADGQVLALQVDPTTNEWVLGYRMALRWRDDTPTWLAFPQMASPTPDAF